MMCAGLPVVVGTSYSEISPAVVMRPILETPQSVNHSAPSGPTVMPTGEPAPVGYAPPELGSGYAAMRAPLVLMQPIWRLSYSVNQRLPSGPAVMRRAAAPAVGMGISTMRGAGLVPAGGGGFLGSGP